MKRFQTAAIALAIAVATPAAFAQDRNEPKEENPRATKPEEKSSPRSAPERNAPEREKRKEQPEREMRKEGDRDNARKPEPKRDAPRDSHPRREGRNSDQPRAEHHHRGEMRTFLGVASSSVHPALREHLDLADGFGIQVEQVLENSPAGKAGLKKSDILILLDDQRLIGPEHLALLVRSMKSGEKVGLTFIRKGKEQTLEVELGEKAESEFGPTGHGHGQRHPYQESMERNQDYWRDWMEQNQDRRSGPNLLERNPRNERDRETGPRIPEGRPPAVSVRPGFPVQIFGASGIMQIDNDEGRLTITEKNGEHHIEIENKQGETVYDGEFDPKKGIESLPVEAREQLEVMKLDNLEILTPPKEKESPEETSAPRLPRSGGQPL